ncbi:MAG: argininosuccinate synthase, partial [Candidatus Binataceae bacterium]
PYGDMFRLTVAPENAPDKAEYVEVEYEGGNPVAINGERLTPAALIARANEIAGRHGVGRADLVENRYVGIKSRGVYESPGVTMLFHAHRAVEQLTLDRELMHLRDSLIPRYAEMVYYGYWFAPEREALQALIDNTQKDVTGIARLKLYKGGVWIVGRKSPNSLYDPALASFDEAGGYRQADAEGFIRIASTRLRALAKASRKREGDKRR